MPMDTTSVSTSRFRFRDHNREMADEESSEGDTTADSSSVSSYEDEEHELQSMTARGVQHLCSELVELKQESDEDFQKNIFSNYSAFLTILKEIEFLQIELLGLKNQAFLQMRLVKDVSDGISLQLLSEESIESLEGTLLVQTSSPSILVTHTNNVSEIFDTLLSEHRLDDAIALLEMERDFVRNLQSGEYSSDEMMFYNSSISDKRAMLADQLALVAKHPWVCAPELQKALFGLCQLGDNHLATQLMLQYYHSRIASRIQNVQSSKEFLDVLYIKEAAKYVCTIISQAARSFMALNGETYAYPSELTQWATEEIKVLSVCFNKYIGSISDVSGKLSTTVDALQIAMWYCSLLETHRIFLKLSLIEYVRPCLEEVVRLHIDHLGKVISIVTSTDTWTLRRYYASGILTGRSNAIVDQQPEYFFLTDSGRKFVTLFKSVAEDISPLIAFHMEGSALKGIMDIFTAYIVILESALTGDTDVMEKGGFRINLPETPTQGVIILANLSSVMQLVSSIIRNIFDGVHQLDFEIDNYIMFIQDIYRRLKACFLDQFISNIFSQNVDHDSSQESCTNGKDNSTIFDLNPSVPYLELYLELKKLEKLGEDNCLDMNWLISLFREVIDATFEWMLSSFEIWTISKQNLAENRTKFIQFILDTEFVVKIATRGEYLSDNAINISNDIVSRLEASFISAGLSPLRGINDDEWPANDAVVALEKVQELHANESLENVNATDAGEEIWQESVYSPAIENASESVTDANTQVSRTENCQIEVVDVEVQNTL